VGRSLVGRTRRNRKRIVSRHVRLCMLLLREGPVSAGCTPMESLKPTIPNVRRLEGNASASFSKLRRTVRRISLPIACLRSLHAGQPGKKVKTWTTHHQGDYRPEGWRIRHFREPENFRGGAGDLETKDK
jgi:hypothetical protein